VELYARVRRAVIVEKMSEREAARMFGLARETVRKMLQYSVPPGYRRQQPMRRPKLGAWIGTIDQILEADKVEGKKHGHGLRLLITADAKEQRHQNQNDSPPIKYRTMPARDATTLECTGKGRWLCVLAAATPQILRYIVQLFQRFRKRNAGIRNS
jgi:hypothetical protein